MSEILGTLFKYLAQIMGVAAVVGIGFLVFGNAKSSNAVSQVNQLAMNTQALYQGQNSFATITVAGAINGRLAPNEMINGNALRCPWTGCTATIAPNANPTMFDITLVGVPADGCNKLGTSMPQAAQMSVNAAAVPIPADAGNVLAACNSAANNTMVFTFSH